MPESNFIRELVSIVGRRHVVTNKRKTDFYRRGFRSGHGSALAVVFPATLIQQWNCLKLCVDQDKIVIMQAANTSLTEGSTPSGDDYDREIVIFNTRRMSKIIIVDQGTQIISFPGATLNALEKLLKPLKRSPHSIIGSSCIGASIIGGVANNSGGALVKRGPAYTEFALFAQLNLNGDLELVNHLGVKGLGCSPEEILTNLENDQLADGCIENDGKIASDRVYADRVRDIDANSPSRYNADKRRLFEASGCAGKLAVFAVRMDTYPIAEKEQTFYIGTDDPNLLAQLRRDILSDFTSLPESAEYMHRDCFDAAEKYGKDTFLLIDYLGTDFMPRLFAIKGVIDAYLNKIAWLPKFLVDRILQFIVRFWPQHLPKRMLDFRDRYEHHLILKMSDAGIMETQSYLDEVFGPTTSNHSGDFFACTNHEARKAYLHRFVAAGAAIRYQIIHSKDIGEILALDIALRRNEQSWAEELPREIRKNIAASFYYGHFLCHVFHQDYVLKKDGDAGAIKKAMLKILDRRGAKYPAEHNMGHLYRAEKNLRKFYETLDPTNSFNPGIGKTSKKRRA